MECHEDSLLPCGNCKTNSTGIVLCGADCTSSGNKCLNNGKYDSGGDLLCGRHYIAMAKKRIKGIKTSHSEADIRKICVNYAVGYNDMELLKALTPSIKKYKIRGIKIHKAVQNNHVDICRYLFKFLPTFLYLQWDVKLVTTCIEYGHLEMLQLLLHSYEVQEKISGVQEKISGVQSILLAIRSEQPSILKYLLTRYESSHGVESIVLYKEVLHTGHASCMRILFQLIPGVKTMFMEERLNNDIFGRNIGMLQLVLETKKNCQLNDIIHMVVYHRNMEALEWSIQNNAIFNDRCLQYAIKGGHGDDTEYIQWVYDKIPSPVNWASVMIYIIGSGSLALNMWYLGRMNIERYETPSSITVLKKLIRAPIASTHEYYTFLRTMNAIDSVKSLFHAHVQSGCNDKKSKSLLAWIKKSRKDLKSVWEEYEIDIMLQKGDDIACKIILHTATNKADVTARIHQKMDHLIESNTNSHLVLAALIEEKVIGPTFDPYYMALSAQVGKYRSIVVLTDIISDADMMYTTIMSLIAHGHNEALQYLLYGEVGPTWSAILFQYARLFILASFGSNNSNGARLFILASFGSNNSNGELVFSTVCEFLEGQLEVENTINEILSDYTLLSKQDEQQKASSKRNINTLIRNQPQINIEPTSVRTHFAVGLMMDHLERLNDSSMIEYGCPFFFLYCTMNEHLLLSDSIPLDWIEVTMIKGMELLIQHPRQLTETDVEENDILLAILKNHVPDRTQLTVAKCAWLLDIMKPELTEKHWQALARIKIPMVFRMFILYSDHPLNMTDALLNIYEDEYITGRMLFGLKPSFHAHFNNTIVGRSSVSNILNRIGIDNNTADLITAYAEPCSIKTLWDELECHRSTL
jgi:hypothetical protein